MICLITTCIILVVIKDVLCNPIVIVEEPTIGSEIKSLSAYLKSLVTNKTTSFRLFEEDSHLSTCLRIDPVSGIVLVKKRIDREYFCPLDHGKCIVKLKFITVPSLQSIATDVEIVDINDNVPTWHYTSISRSINEFQQLTADVPLFYLDNAQDPDSDENGRVTYFLKEADKMTESRNFRVDQSSASANRLKIYPTKVIDREVETVFNLVLLAIDKGSTSLTGSLKIEIKVLDVNDNSPVFQKLVYVNNILSESATIGSKVLIVWASDKDAGENGRISYRIDDRLSSRFFKIDERGIITVNQKLDYDRGMKSFSFMVMAFDNAPEPYRKSGHCNVIVHLKDENDEKPVIVIHVTAKDPITNMATIRENEPTTNLIVAHVQVTDLDFNGSDRVKCTLNDNIKLRLEEVGLNEYQIIALSKYDREEQFQEIAIVTCLDQAQNVASSTTLFKIMDENDNSPTFSRSYHFSVRENSTNTHHVVGTVLATDTDEGQNALIRYEIAGDGNRDFAIDWRGEISTKHPLDREEVDRFDLTILAKDGGRPSRTGSVLVVIDVVDINDWPPEFNASSYEFRIAENSKIGSTIGSVYASDRDLQSQTTLKYKISAATFYNKHPFRIVRGRIVSSAFLDREDQPVYDLIVSVEDSGLPVSLTSTVAVKIVLLDVNDNSPVFVTQNYTKFYVQITDSVGHEIGTVTANDADFGDNADLEYSVMAGDGSKHLVLNPGSGKLNLAHQISRQGSRKLMIEACDKGTPRRCSRPLWIIVKVTRPTTVDGSEMVQNESSTDSKTYIFIICALVILLVTVIVLVICAFIFKDRICAQVPREDPCPSDLRINEINSTERNIENETMLMGNYPNTASPRSLKYGPCQPPREAQIHSDYQSLEGGSPQYVKGAKFIWDMGSTQNSFQERVDPFYARHVNTKDYYSPPPGNTCSTNYNSYSPLRFRTMSHVHRWETDPRNVQQLPPRKYPDQTHNSLYNIDHVTPSLNHYHYMSLRRPDRKASFV